MKRFSNLINLFFCTLPDSDFSNNYESPIKWCTVDLFLRECWVLKRLISKYYFLQKSSISSIDYKTVRDYFSTVESSHYYGGYSSSDDSDNDEPAETKNIDLFEQEYDRMEESFNEMSFVSSGINSGGSKSGSLQLNSSHSVCFDMSLY